MAKGTFLSVFLTLLGKQLYIYIYIENIYRVPQPCGKSPGKRMLAAGKTTIFKSQETLYSDP